MVMAAEANARVLSGFLDYLRIEKGLAVLSINAYATDLLQFAEFLEKKRRLLMTARRTDVREFPAAAVFASGGRTQRGKEAFGAASSLSLSAALDKKIEQDPTLNIESPRQWKVLPKSLARDEEWSRRWHLRPRSWRTEVSASQDATALAARDRAMLELLYAGALRVSELVNSTLEDLKLDAGYMLVRGKGDKERIVPLPQAGAGRDCGISGSGASGADQEGES